MRYRFSAATSDGQVRSGYLEAEDEAGANRQIERRGLTLQSLDKDDSETPTYVNSEIGALTSKMPLPYLPTPPLWRRVDWARVDWRRLGLAGMVAAIVLGIIGYGLSRALADKTYHLRLTGQFHLATKRKVQPDYWKKVHPRVWLPKPRWFIGQSGVIYAEASGGKWKPISRRADVQYKANIEGNYIIDIEVALPSPPEGCGVSFTSRGFKRVSKKGMFKPKKDLLECQVPIASLKPMSTKGKHKGKRKRKKRKSKSKRA